MRRVLVVLTVAFVLACLVGAFFAVNNVLPAKVPDPQSPQTVAQEALFGWGTALSGPGWVLALLLALAVIVSSSDLGGRLAAAMLVLLGAAGVAKAFGEPVIREALQTPQADTMLTSLALLLILLPALIAVVGIGVVAADVGQDRRY